ncbi:MAG: type II secretion system F family protein [Planctomycetes bacterium]|nr:type II secretion system F family protein [Planctomycetota bacterium]
MPKFKYTAKNAKGKKVSGTITMNKESDVNADLKKQGLMVISIKAETKKGGGGFSDLFKPKPSKRIKADELTIFTRQLSTMISAGIPLVECLEVLSEQIDKPGFRLVLESIVDKVRGGADFSESLQSHPKIFTRIYVSMVKAGEASGQLDIILQRLAEYLESSQALKREIKAAMTYPVISLCLIFAIVVALMVGVIPQFKSIFISLNVELPALTRYLLLVSDFMQSYFLVWMGALAGAIVGIMYFKKTKPGSYLFDWLALHLPVFGTLFQKIAISRFSRTFATLIRSGVPILGALEIVANTSGNRLIEDTVNEARENVRKGETLSDPLSRSKVFPPMVTRMIGIGEKSGALEALLEKISEFYDQQVETAVKSLTSMIEPIMIGIMGVVVGGIVLAVFMPILEIQKTLSK